MGAALSEPCTRCDLNHPFFRCHDDRAYAANFKWFSPELSRFKFNDVVTGGLHVDDMLILSKIWCADCIATRTTAMMPDDIGLQEEERGPTLRFLSLIVDIGENSTMRFIPCNPNIWYGLNASKNRRRHVLENSMTRKFRPII